MQDKSYKALTIVSMLLLPIAGLVLILKSKAKEHITLLGTLFFGLIGSLYIYNPGSDGFVHLQDVNRFYSDMSFKEFIDDTFRLLTLQSTETSKDFYKHFVSYLAGAVFGLPELIHVFTGLLLGYFFTKSVLLVVEVIPRQNKSILLILFITLFLIVRSISALNSLRMWVAMWVFFYGALLYIKRKNLKHLWIVGLAIFIHFSYALFVIPLIGAVILRKQKLIIVGIFVASFFVNVGFEQMTNIVDSAGVYEDTGGGNIIDEEERERRVTVDAEKKQNRGSSNFYKEFGPMVYSKFSIPLLTFALIFVYLKKKRENVDYVDFLIGGGLLLLALSNLAGETSPAVNGRGSIIAATFITAAAIQVIALRQVQIFSRTMRSLLRLSFVVFIISAIPHILFHISYTINTISYTFLGLPVASWFIGNEDISIKQFIKILIP